MGSPPEGSSLRIFVQAVVYSNCSRHGCYIHWRCTSPWECDWINDIELWVLYCDLGQSKRRCNQNSKSF
ncbi:unnamed protein product [Arabidopsis lyrata]|uniref:Predicted protein n=1 Tax=Arabidopsis lyrata subsp. lyrata TaxID=81972 RepID=D7MJA7_ARALL|nr:predicted protein [Arabidopsis lyrata subsp. lyrata]CAH8277627.1 unnamed protein product [Arabidopsis lyrata]